MTSPSSAKPAKQAQRRRARRACIACREWHILYQVTLIDFQVDERKVRCDVLQRQPCTNCEEDRCRCIVRQHANRRASVSALELPSPRSRPVDGPSAGNPVDAQINTENTFVSSQRPQINSIPQQLPQAASSGMINPQPLFHSSSNFDMHIDPDWTGSSSVPLVQPDNGAYDDFGQPLFYDFDGGDMSALIGLERVFNPSTTYTDTVMSQPIANPSPNVSISAMDSEYLDLSGLLIEQYANQPNEERSEELQFLQSQGCFRFPPTHLLLDLMKAYFKYVHPNLPIINEADFWNLWPDDDIFQLGSFSILVLQAMAFAATSVSHLSHGTLHGGSRYLNTVCPARDSAAMWIS